ncbi:MAG TPA: 50S ribosomal protein L25 [Candidatus Acidoferrum sp.]|nr:50S ribosomal protein L25 [Candidatus Acidoferrum sp.]
MSKNHSLSSLTLVARDHAGTTTAKALRKAGKVPGVVYGHGTSTPIAIDAKELAELLLSGSRSKVVEATIAGAKDSVLLRKIESDPISRRPLSVDFQRVSRDEAVFATVTVTTVGNPRGVRERSGILDVVTHTLEIKGPAQSLPDHLEVDVNDLDVHEHLTAGQVPLPKGFTLVTPPETTVVSVETHRGVSGAGFDNAEEQPTEAPEG